jgi:predicted esterase
MSSSQGTHTIAVRTHGRYLLDHPAPGEPVPALIGFHGYGERAEDMLEPLRRIRGTRPWLLVSVQALNRFYTKAQDVVANWMTREDRELAIRDNVDYVAAVVAAVSRAHRIDYVAYAGFSQGVAMAYRALAFAGEPGHNVPAAAGGIMLAGDIPPDVVAHLPRLPPLLIGRGTDDEWYTAAKADADASHFARSSVQPQVHVFSGGHVWDASFEAAAGVFLDRIGAEPERHG